jgi:adenylosuccinate synthase
MNALTDLRRTPVIVTGLGYGDEAKGATTDALARAIPDTAAVVRWSGGAQAAHNVRHGARHHTFHQFGSATFLDVPTYLLAPAMLHPQLLVAEAHELASKGVTNPLDLITVDTGCLVTTPINQAMNRARELARGDGRHGSTGIGIGETVAYDLACRAGARAGDLVGNFTAPGEAGRRALRAGDLTDRHTLTAVLDEMMRYAAPLLAGVDDPGGLLHIDPIDALVTQMLDVGVNIRTTTGDSAVLELLNDGSVLYEGSQGILLDEDYGFHPHTTWATTSPRRLRAHLVDQGHHPFVLGLTRTYATRHGAGPMPTEAELGHPELDNGTEVFTGGWRQGHLDLVTLRYAAAVAGGVDAVSVSHLDAPQDCVVTSWGLRADALLRGTNTEPLSQRRTVAAENAAPVYAPVADSQELLEHITRAVGAPVALTADGPRRTDRSFA